MLKNPDWKKRVKPDLKTSEKNIRSFLKFFSYLLLVFLLLVIVTATINKQYVITAIGVVSVMYVVEKLLNLSPNFYNLIFSKKKIVPIGENVDRDHILQEICKTQTPYGQPLMGFYGNFILNAPAYILKDEGFIIYFYIRNNDFIIRSKLSKKGDPGKTLNRKISKVFHNDLVRMFNFIINMDRQPSNNELAYIFKNSLALEAKK